MALMILLAFLNGLAVSVSRVIEARFALARGPAAAAAASHIAGFVVLLALVALGEGLNSAGMWAEVPKVTYLAGIASAAFVFLASWVIPRVGAMKSILLIVGGQMLCAALIDGAMGRVQSLTMELLGVGLIVVGINILNFAARRPG